MYPNILRNVPFYKSVWAHQEIYGLDRILVDQYMPVRS